MSDQSEFNPPVTGVAPVQEHEKDPVVIPELVEDRKKAGGISQSFSYTLNQVKDEHGGLRGAAMDMMVWAGSFYEQQNNDLKIELKESNAKIDALRKENENLRISETGLRTRLSLAESNRNRGTALTAIGGLAAGIFGPLVYAEPSLVTIGALLSSLMTMGFGIFKPQKAS